MITRITLLVLLFLGTLSFLASQTVANLTDAELEPVTKHAIKGRRLQEDIRKLQEKINTMPEVKHVQEFQKQLQDEETLLSKSILKAHKLDDGKHVVDFQQGRIVEQQPPPKSAEKK